MFLLLVKDCIGIEIVEIKCLNSLLQWKKKKLREQFIQLVEVPFYFMYFVKSTSSIPSRPENVLCQQNNFRETLKLVIYFGLSRGENWKNVFPILASREKKPWKRGRANHDV